MFFTNKQVKAVDRRKNAYRFLFKHTLFSEYSPLLLQQCQQPEKTTEHNGLICR